MSAMIPEHEALEQAARLIGQGELVAVPTETVYGLAGDAANGLAVASIFEAKGRPHFNPLICHVSGVEMARRLATFDPLAEQLAKAFWPGPLTLVLPLKPGAAVHDLVTGGLDTIAVRHPKGFVAELCRLLDRPVAAPSANRSGKITATSAAAAEAGLGDVVPLIADGGPCEIGLESTIISIDNDGATMLRPGGIPARDIEAVIGQTVRRAPAGNVITAPGMMTSHYAPAAHMRLNADQVKTGEALLGFGPRRAEGAEEASTFANLSESGDLREAAANLFAMMMQLDEGETATIAVEPIPTEGLGEAINDRLMRAAAPRDT